MKKSLFTVLIFAIFSTLAFAEVSFLSPSAGVWGNKQMLIIDNAQEGDYYFYSINGSDPEKFGFAYDGPVLLDIEGDVTVKVAHFDSEGNKDYGEVHYSVVQDDGSAGGYSNFISQFSAAGFYDYIAGENFEIPSTLSFSFEQEPASFVKGTVLYVNSYNVLKRYIPCTIYDKSQKLYWRFIIKMNPAGIGTFSKREVPFTIDNWDTITFVDDSLIYKIDSEYWGQPTEPVTIDRSVSHMISWQSVDYKAGNSIEYYVLPPRAEVVSKINDDGSYLFYIDGDDTYKLGLLPEDEVLGQELFTEIGVDAFYGDKVSGRLQIGIYADSIYQGNITEEYNIDKLPPAMPKLEASSKTFYSRNPVDVNISSDPAVDLYIAVSEPFYINNTREVYNENSQIFNNVNVGQFKNFESGIFSVSFPITENKVVYYKVEAYTQKGEIKSDKVVYSVIIDQSGYFYNKSSISNIADGSLLNPFVDFDQFVKAIANCKSASLSVNGDLYINKSYKITTNLKLINGGNGRIIFGPDGSIEMDGASLEISDYRMHKISSFEVTTILPFFKIKNGVLNIKNCQIAGDFSKNGTIIDSFNSIIDVQDTIAAVSADSYASFISSVDSSVSIFNSSITGNGGTCVIISANNGEVDVCDNKFKLLCKTGRIAELFGVNACIENNEFRIQIDKSSKNLNPIFANKKTILEEKDNKQIGF